MGITLPLALSLLNGVKTNGSAYKALCPAHTDRNPSLSLSVGKEQELILRCHAGCSYDDVITSLKLQLKPSNYTYMNENGEPVGRVSRKYDKDGNKSFYQSVPNNGKWKAGSSDTFRETPYHLPEVLSAIDRGNRIFIVEGEKDADRLIDEGHIATCNVGGVAMGWTDKHSEWLIGAKRIFIIADNDEPGLKQAWRTYDSLKTVGIDCRITVHTSPFAKDISDHLILGHALREIQTIERQEEYIEADPRWMSLASFIFDSPPEIPAVWGHDGKTILWAKGQGLMIVAPQGVGKTTLSGLLIESLLGFTNEVLGMPVKPVEKGLAYFAMDRPDQIALSLRRIFNTHGREAVEKAKNAHVRKGPPLRDLSKHPTDLRDMLIERNCDCVFIDSLKDAVLKLSQEEPAQGWNLAVQECLMAGIQVCILNHPVKHAGMDLKPVSLDDVYGSGWITAGLGSVLSLWGEKESSFAEFSQLKMPGERMETITVKTDRKAGTMSIVGTEFDWAWFFMQPHTIHELQIEMYGDENSKANYNKAKKQVDDMLGRRIIEQHSKTTVTQGQGRPAARYILRQPE
ncbi:MAG: hypothetical protein ACREOZ_02080 [Gloeomargaritales cyanobacterium]